MPNNRKYNAEEAAKIIQELQEEEDVSDDDVIDAQTDNDSEVDSEDIDSDTDSEDIRDPPIVEPPPLTSRDGTQWHNQPDNNIAVRAPLRNIIRHQGGATVYILQRSNDIVDIFLELFDINNIDDIIRYTNNEAATRGVPNFNLDRIELKAFIGLCIYRGVTKGRNEPLHSFWSEETGRDLFTKTMPRQRFQSILRFIRFDEKATRVNRRREDRFCIMRTIWDRMMIKASRAYRPHESVTIDEQLLSCRARCSFIQYMPAKPGKFGIKFWLMCDASTYYILRGYPYVGADPDRVEVGLGEHTVMKLTDGLEDGVNITTDNFFTSQQLANRLCRQNKTIVGTVRSNRREIPKEMHEVCKTAPLYDSNFLFSNNTTLLGYKAKRNKTVYLLSSIHKDGKVAENTKKTPEIVDFYNNTKYGVDKADEMLKEYSSKAASRRWPLYVFFNMVDICCLNAFIIAKDTQLSQTSRRNFYFALSKQLCKAHIDRRQGQQLPPLQRRQGDAAGHNENLPRRTTCRRCHKNKTKITCAVCNVYCCGTCSSQVCLGCLPK